MSMHGVNFAIAEEESDSMCLPQLDRPKPRGADDVSRVKKASL